MVIVKFSEYSHRRLTPKEIKLNLDSDFKFLNEHEIYHTSWEEFKKRRTSSNRYRYSWDTISEERIIGKGSRVRIFNAIIVPWLRERIQDLRNSEIYDSDLFNIFIIDEDINTYSFNIQKKDGLSLIVAKIKELMNINNLESIRLVGPVNESGKNFIENKQLYDRNISIEKVKVV